MTTAEAIQYFGGQSKLAAALGIRQPSVSGWDEYPPALRQIQLERITLGALRAEPDCFPTARPVAA